MATGLTDQEMYASVWLSFEQWASAHGVPALPASPELVAPSLTELDQDRQLSVATIRLHKAALSAVHRAGRS